jgi:hypothetical protein
VGNDTSYRRLSKKAVKLCELVIHKMRAEGYSDDQIAFYLNSVLEPAFKERAELEASSIQGAIQKSLENPGRPITIGTGGNPETGKGGVDAAPVVKGAWKNLPGFLQNPEHLAKSAEPGKARAAEQFERDDQLARRMLKVRAEIEGRTGLGGA